MIGNCMRHANTKEVWEDYEKRIITYENAYDKKRERIKRNDHKRKRKRHGLVVALILIFCPLCGKIFYHDEKIAK